jgi:site-specific recombinase XerD
VLRLAAETEGGMDAVVAAAPWQVDRMGEAWRARRTTGFGDWTPALRYFYAFCIEQRLREGHPMEAGRQDTALAQRFEAWLRALGKTASTARQHAAVALQAAAVTRGGMDALVSATAAELEPIREAWLRRPRGKNGQARWDPAVRYFYSFLFGEGLRGDHPLEPDAPRRPAEAVRRDVELTGRFEAWMCRRGRADTTARRYAGIVRATAAVTEGGMDALMAAEAADLERALEAWRRKSPRKDGLILWRPSMRYFFEFLADEGLRKDHPLGAAVAQRPEKRARAQRKRPATELELLRDSVILHLLTRTDLKPAELRVMAVGCYDWRLGHLVAGPRRRVMLDGRSQKELEAYLARPRDVNGSQAPLSADAPLFPDFGAGGLLSQNHYWGIIRQALRRAEMERQAGEQQEETTDG